MGGLEDELEASGCDRTWSSSEVERDGAAEAMGERVESSAWAGGRKVEGTPDVPDVELSSRGVYAGDGPRSAMVNASSLDEGAARGPRPKLPRLT